MLKGHNILRLNPRPARARGRAAMTEHVVEVFPALLVAAFENAFFDPRKVPKIMMDVSSS